MAVNRAAAEASIGGGGSGQEGARRPAARHTGIGGGDRANTAPAAPPYGRSHGTAQGGWPPRRRHAWARARGAVEGCCAGIYAAGASLAGATEAGVAIQLAPAGVRGVTGSTTVTPAKSHGKSCTAGGHRGRGHFKSSGTNTQNRALTREERIREAGN